MSDLTIHIHEIAVVGLPPTSTDGYPPAHLAGRIAFLYKDCIVSGFPLRRDRFPDLYPAGYVAETLWQADSKLGRGLVYRGVTHWAELPATPLCPPGRRAAPPCPRAQHIHHAGAT